MGISEAVGTIRQKAAELREILGSETSANALEWAAQLIETASKEEQNELLSLKEAARLSGYSRDHLSRLIRTGKIANAGRPHSPRIRRSELPRRARAVAHVADVSHIGGASATQVARSLVERGRP